MGDPETYLVSRALSIGIPPELITSMPRGELEDLVDANLILNGYCDESIVNDYIDVDLE